MVDKDGVWDYDPVTDRMRKVGDVPRNIPSDGKDYSSDPWSYSNIKRELERVAIMSESYARGRNLHNRINNLSDPDQRSELQYLLEERIARAKRNEELDKEENDRKKRAERRKLEGRYRQAWNDRNFLWKFFHKQYNPDKKDLKDLSNASLANYTEIIGKRK